MHYYRVVVLVSINILPSIQLKFINYVRITLLTNSWEIVL
jgi:hypothetical protein